MIAGGSSATYGLYRNGSLINYTQTTVGHAITVTLVTVGLAGGPVGINAILNLTAKDIINTRWLTSGGTAQTNQRDLNVIKIA